MRRIKGLWAKTSTLTRVLLIGGALGIVYLAFGMVYLQQQHRQDELRSKIAISQRVVAEEPRSHRILEEELEKAVGRLAASWLAFPKKQSSTEVIDAVQKEVQASQVELLSIESGSMEAEKIGEHSYLVLSFTLAVSGELPKLQAFLHQLEAGTIATLVVDSVNLDELGDSFVMSLRFSIYDQDFTPELLFAIAPRSSAKYPFTIDMTEPDTALSSDLSSLTNDNVPIFTGEAVDAITAIVAVEYRADGSRWLPAKPTDGGFDQSREEFTFTINNALDDGSHLIETRAIDAAGNIELSYSRVTLSVDTMPPLVTITALSPTLVARERITLTGTAIDEASSISSVEYRIDGDNWLPATALDGAFDSQAEAYTFTTSGLAEGAHGVEVRATDAAGNTTATAFTWGTS